MINRAKVDSSIKLRGKKIGIEWRIYTESINDHLGIEVIDDEFKESYIKELEVKLSNYKMKIESLKSVMITINKLFGISI